MRYNWAHSSVLPPSTVFIWAIITILTVICSSSIQHTSYLSFQAQRVSLIGFCRHANKINEFPIKKKCMTLAAGSHNIKGILYEIEGESRPLSAFFPTHADFFTFMHFYS